MEIYLTIDPEKRFSPNIIQYPLIQGVRCNTGAPISGSKTDALKDFRSSVFPKQAFVDLKCREIRIVKEATVPNEYLEINHRISLRTPTAFYYNAGKDYLIIEDIVDENKILVKRPKNYTGKEKICFGKGASINIPDSSLIVFEYFTPNDIEYVEAAKKIDLHNYVLSYVESGENIDALLELDPNATIFAKIENKKGLNFVKNEYGKYKRSVRLIAAREDLYIELDRPHEILNSLRLIIQKDPRAIGASRILESFLALQDIPSCADICDVAFLMEIGYNAFLLGDEICANEEILNSAYGLLKTIDAEKYINQ